MVANCTITIELTAPFNGYHHVGKVGRSEPCKVAFETNSYGYTRYWTVEGVLSKGQKEALEDRMRKGGLVLKDDKLPEGATNG